MPRAKRITNFREKKLHDALDDLADFEEFSKELLPAIKRDILSGMDSEQLLKKHQALAAARLISIAASEADSSKAASAAKDILDRTMGKAKESKEIHHKLQDLTDKELDSLLTSELQSLADEEELDA